MKQCILILCFTLKVIIAGAQCWNEQYYNHGSSGAQFVKIIENTIEGGSFIFWAGANDTNSRDIETEYNREIWILKNDVCGNRIWKKHFGFNDSVSEDNFNDAIITPDSCLLVLGGGDYIGDGFSSGTLYKIDFNGKLIWKKWYGGRNVLVPKNITYNPYRNTYILSGRIERIGNGGLWNRAYLMEVDSAGNQLNEKDIMLNYDTAHANFNHLMVNALEVLPDSNILTVIIGDTFSMVKFTPTFDIIWKKEPISFVSDDDGWGDFSLYTNYKTQQFYANIATVFLTNTIDSDGLWLTKFNSNGSVDETLMLQQKYQGGGAMSLTPDDGYLYGLDSLIKYNANYEAVYRFGLPHAELYASYRPRLIQSIQLKTGAYVGVGTSPYNTRNRNDTSLPIKLTYAQLYIMQTDTAGNMPPKIKQGTPHQKTNIIVYPNPNTTGIFNIKNIQEPHINIHVYGSNGQEIFNVIVKDATFDLSNEPSGLYYIRLSNPAGTIIHQQTLILSH
jgi:hypothetical protein